MSQKEKEKKNEQMGAIISVGAHVVVFLLFFFIVAWRAPDPPMPEIGIELNFGLDDAGSGEEQPEPNTQPAESESEEEAAPDGLEETPEEVVEEVTETITEPTEAVDEPTEEVATPVDNTNESPDVVEEIPEPVIKEEKKEEVVKEKETPKVPPVLYPNKTPGAGGKDGKSNEAKNANQGDQTNAEGDQGDKNGTVESKALYGNAGGGGGSSLQMSGWKWDYEPNPDYPKSLNQSGKIVFQVVIDDKGNIVRIITETSTVSPSLEKVYKDEVRKLTFSKTSGTGVEARSTGTITFVIKAR